MKILSTIIACLALITWPCFSQTIIKSNNVGIAWGSSSDDPAAGGSMPGLYYKLWITTNASATLPDYSSATIISNNYTFVSPVEIVLNNRLTLAPNVMYWMKVTCTAPDELESDPTPDFLIMYVPPKKPKQAGTPYKK